MLTYNTLFEIGYDSLAFSEYCLIIKKLKSTLNHLGYTETEYQLFGSYKRVAVKLDIGDESTALNAISLIRSSLDSDYPTRIPRWYCAVYRDKPLTGYQSHSRGYETSLSVKADNYIDVLAQHGCVVDEQTKLNMLHDATNGYPNLKWSTAYYLYYFEGVQKIDSKLLLDNTLDSELIQAVYRNILQVKPALLFNEADSNFRILVQYKQHLNLGKIKQDWTKFCQNILDSVAQLIKQDQLVTTQINTENDCFITGYSNIGQHRSKLKHCCLQLGNTTAAKATDYLYCSNNTYLSRRFPELKSTYCAIIAKSRQDYASCQILLNLDKDVDDVDANLITVLASLDYINGIILTHSDIDLYKLNNDPYQLRRYVKTIFKASSYLELDLNHIIEVINPADYVSQFMRYKLAKYFADIINIIPLYWGRTFKKLLDYQNAYRANTELYKKLSNIKTRLEHFITDKMDINYIDTSNHEHARLIDLCLTEQQVQALSFPDLYKHFSVMPDLVEDFLQHNKVNNENTLLRNNNLAIIKLLLDSLSYLV